MTRPFRIKFVAGDWPSLEDTLNKFSKHIASQPLTEISSPTFTDLILTSPSNIYDLSHDSFADFVADEHIAHSDVSIIAGTGLSGGGTIAASRTLNCTITQYADESAQDAVGGILDDGTVGNVVFTYDDDTPKISAVVQEGEIDHNSLLNVHQDVNTDASPSFVDVTLTGKLDVGSQESPIDVTVTREHGVEIHYSGNNYNVTGIRSRGQLVTTDTAAQAQGGLFQAANNDGINAGCLNGLVSEAIGKSTANAATIAMMRGALVGAEWGAFDTVTALNTLHVRVHSRNAAGAGSFGDGYGIYIENEAVGGNGQALDAGIYFKDTNISGGNKAFTYGIDFSGGTFAIAEIKLKNGGTIGDYIDIVEMTAPSAPTSGSNTLRIYTEAIHGFSLLKFIDDTGMKREFVRDSIITVYNDTGDTILANRVVYTVGSSDNVPSVALAKANSLSTMPAIGVTIEDIPDESYGRVMQVGILENVDTSAFDEGDVLYVHDTIAGLVRITPPVTPSLTQEMGTVLVSNETTGSIQIVARGLTGNEYGTIQDDFYIGDGVGNSKALHFNAATDGSITWDETKFDLGGSGLSTTGDCSVGALAQTSASRFRVRLSTDQSITQNTWQKIVWNIEDFDTRSEFDMINDWFKPDTAGYYEFHFNAIFTPLSSGKQMIIGIFKNGVCVCAGRTSPGVVEARQGSEVSTIAYLDGDDDYIEAKVYQTCAGAMDLQGSADGYVTFSGHRLS